MTALGVLFKTASGHVRSLTDAFGVARKGLKQRQMADEHRLAPLGLAPQQALCSRELSLPAAHQEAHQDIRIDAEHQPDSCSIGNALRPRRRRDPARLMTLLFLTRISTVPSGIGVKVIRSPAFKRRLSRIALGTVVWPLLVSSR
jgi:hypothetical protein